VFLCLAEEVGLVLPQAQGGDVVAVHPIPSSIPIL
jgi:hypothetical protein